MTGAVKNAVKDAVTGAASAAVSARAPAALKKAPQLRFNLHLQGQVFCVLALALVISSLAGLRLAPRQELLTAGAWLLLLGMPHGAFDGLLARQLFGVVGPKAWALFSLCYVGLAAGVVALWVVAPTLFLCAFLIASAVHFGADPVDEISKNGGSKSCRVWLTRGLYGGAVIVLPALFHGAELQHLLGLVAGPGSAAGVAPVLSLLAPPWLVATAVASALQARRSRRSRRSRRAACESAALVALLLAAPPLVAFSVYFCAMHSPRHVLRTLARVPAGQARGALLLALWPTLAVLAVLAALAMGAWLGWLKQGLPFEAGVMQLVFVSLAALTLPHMLLLEQVRRRAQRAGR